jgi:DNA (cytosine-5)-methyltransferase 1
MLKTHQRVTVGCLFAAMGGFARAFQQSQAEVLWANEKDKFATETFVANFPKVTHFHKPIESLTVVGDKLQPVDVVTAGFPCQPFSVAGEKRGFQDKERGMLFLEIIRLIGEFGKKKPKILLLENVQHFRNHDNGRTFKRVQAEIQKAGYWFTDKNVAVLNTAEHTNIPQNRDRIFMAAFSCDHFASNTFRFPAPYAGEMRPLSSFLDLDRKQDDRYYFQPGSRYYPHFVEALKQGKPDSVYQLRRNYVRENRSGECFTLMANMGDGGHNVPVIKDSWGIRKMTPRECVRLQGYGDDFIFPPHLSHAQLGKQIGNSVTVPLVKLLADQCVATIRGLSVAQRPTTRIK